jgi:methionyl-tRNA synthetase
MKTPNAPFYVTTPIYYVNGLPHIGHAYTTIAADAIARWHRLNGREVFFLTGTDEHGTKVLEFAKKRGMSPKEHCDDMVVHWRAMWQKLGVGYDRFLRTTDADHASVVQGVLQKLWDEGLIYRSDYTGWYSVSAERFWTEKDLVDGKCPETGQAVQKITETNYFFKMGQFQQALVDHIEANAAFIRPESRRNEVLGFLRRPLEDLCISRPKARMSWGIELPFDPDYVTYVWFDALLNYLTGAGYDPRQSSVIPKFWPADFQLLGKDILTTHAVYWSTMLLALGLPLPRTLYAHGWWVSSDGAKMSKSLGNTIDVGLLVDAFGPDATRYFFLREIAFGADGAFSYEGFLTRYNADLANDLGNLAHRGLSMTTNWLEGRVPAITENTPAEFEFRAIAARAVAGFADAIAELQFHRALEALWELVRAGNKYIDTEQPWALNKRGDRARLQTVKRHVLEACAIAGVLLLPIVPDKAAELLRRLGLSAADAAERIPALVAAARAGSLEFELLTTGASLEVGEPLFPRFREMPEGIAALFAAAAPPVAEDAPLEIAQPITYDDFAKIQLRTGKVLHAERHPKADRLLVLRVDIGERRPRQIVAGIANRYAPEDLVGRHVVVVANLQPAKLRGVMSEGMLLAAGGESVVDLVRVEADPGEIVR